MPAQTKPKLLYISTCFEQLLLKIAKLAALPCEFAAPNVDF